MTDERIKLLSDWRDIGDVAGRYCQVRQYTYLNVPEHPIYEYRCKLADNKPCGRYGEGAFEGTWHDCADCNFPLERALNRIAYNILGE